MELENIIDIELDDICEVGPQGLSAYEVYQKNGGKLSEEEWLESLKGEKGEPGKDGMDGIDGIDGKDAPTYIAGENITIDENNVISASGGVNLPIYIVETEIGIHNSNPTSIYTTPTISSVNLTDIYDKISEIINEVYSAGEEAFQLILKAGKWQIPFYCCNILRGALGIQNKQPNIYMSTPYMTPYSITGINQDGAATLGYASLYIDLTWNENICTVTSAKYSWRQINVPAYENVLPKDNLNSYTPTSDYHPATKKYVDNSASLPNGIYKLYSETTYSDLYVSARPDNSEEMLAKVSNIINDAFNKGFITGILFDTNNSSSYYKLYSPRNLSSITTKPTKLYFYAQVASFYSTNMDYALQIREPNLIINGTWNGDVFTATSFSYGNVGTIYMDCWTKGGIEKYYLKKTNKTEYTPTEDYNPATKKYVDDSIKSAITTVLEGEY